MLLGTELTGPIELIVALLVVTVAAVVVGTVSFGFGLASSPPLLLFLEPKSAIVIVNSLTVIVLVMVFASTWRHLDLRHSKGMIIGGLLGTPVGALLLDQAEPSLLRLIIGVMIVAMGLLSLREVRFPYATFPGSGLVFGFVTCLMVTATSIGGLIGGVYAVAQKWPAQTVRASLAAMFTVTGMTQVVLYAVTGLYSQSTLTIVGLLIPGVLVGFWLASKLVGRLNEQTFRYAVIAMVVTGGTFLLGRELLA